MQPRIQEPSRPRFRLPTRKTATGALVVLAAVAALRGRRAEPVPQSVVGDLRGLAPRGSAVSVPRHEPLLRGPRPRPRVAHDRRGEDLAAHEPGRGDPAARRAASTSGGTRRCTASRARASPPSSRRRSASPRRSTRRSSTRWRSVVSDEARAKHHQFVREGRRERYQGLTFWSPNINIFRDPRWGRGQETYGEDPFLTGRLGVEFVKGLQGDDPRYYKVIATAKHYAVHSGPEPERHHVRRAAERARPPRDLPAGVPRARAGRRGRLGDERLQPRERRVGDREPAAARRHPARGVGLRAATSCPTAAPSTTSSCATRSSRRRRGGLGPRAHARLRPRVRQLVQVARQGARGRAREGVGPRRRAVERLMLARMRLGMFDPPEKVALRAHPVLGERRARARPPRAARRAGVDRAPEERRRPAAAQGREDDRRRGADGRRPRDASSATTTARRRTR